jgi:hypothetical protein
MLNNITQINENKMKKLIFLLVVLLLISCNKAEDDSQSKQTVAGTWNKICTPQAGNTFSGVLTLQQNANVLTGNFISSDNSFYGTLTSTSIINGTTVTIAWTIPATSTHISITYNFQGTINSTFSSMSGTFYYDLPTNERRTGTWIANKK